MAKVRVFELAQEIGIGNKELLSRLQELGIRATNHMSPLEPEEVARVRVGVAQAAQSGSAAQPLREERIRGTIIRRRLGAAPAPAAPEPTRPGGSAAPEVPGLTAVPEDRSAEASPRRADVATASGDTVAPRPGPVAREEAPAPLGGAPNAALPESRPADAGPRPAAQDDRPAGAPPRRADVPPAAEAPTASREAAAPTPEPRGPREGEAQRVSSQPPPSPSPAEPRPATARPAAGPAGGPPRPEAPGAGPARPRPDFSPGPHSRHRAGLRGPAARGTGVRRPASGRPRRRLRRPASRRSGWPGLPRPPSGRPGWRLRRPPSRRSGWPQLRRPPPGRSRPG
jgi:translation initiation factor IF-2